MWAGVRVFIQWTPDNYLIKLSPSVGSEAAVAIALAFTALVFFGAPVVFDWFGSDDGISERYDDGETLDQDRRTRNERRRHHSSRKEHRRQSKADEKKYAIEKWERYYKWMRIEETDEMTGIQFERFIATVLLKSGFQNVTETPTTGDQGADLICIAPDGRKCVIQTKRWKNVVGNKAIQEILGAMLNYEAKTGIVVTNSRFTGPARDLAAKDDRIQLIDRTVLAKMIRETFPEKVVPEFDWEEYNKNVKYWTPF